MTWTWMCTFVRHDELRRAVTSFEFCIAAECLVCISDVMIDIFVVTLHVLKRACVKSCGMTSCDVSRGAATRFEFWIAIKICHSTDVIIEIFGPPFTWVDVYIRVACRAATCREVLWRALNFVKRWKIYICCIADVMIELFCRQFTWRVTLICPLVWYDELRRATRCCDEICISYCGEKCML
jgi:hypothetical protein